jgi:hypothetical protein
MDFDEELDTERCEQLNTILQSILDAAATAHENEEDGRRQHSSAIQHRLFQELLAAIPEDDDPLERELLDALLKHSPSLNLMGVASAAGGISMEKAAKLVELATIDDDEEEDASRVANNMTASASADTTTSSPSLLLSIQVIFRM